ncbi:MAG: CHAD domain-containing protein [Anaerolineales bacterium]|nr:CHAD domain-containing protein [Anaerolineales bacterium]MCB0011785.1 CHAD domain-containing protein [Anaerolineales bacterium]MCB0017400.1 CHAD domain-containing protein [Anaerolineales bacterium]MCB8959056.1 CHAD domain-containing protein [Ardenticatenales bacterium]
MTEEPLTFAQYVLATGEEPVAGCCRLLLAYLAENCALLQDDEMDLDLAVHEARKNVKRMRAFLRLIRPVIGEPAFQRVNDQLQGSAHLLAPMRDQAVLIETVANLRLETGLELSHFRHTLVLLTEAYQATRADFVADAGRIPAILGIWQAVRDEILALPLGKGGWNALQPGFSRSYTRGRQRMFAAYAQPANGELFHEWRKRVKDMWHQLEILAPAAPDTLLTEAEAYHQLSSLLGDAHDLLVLRETILAAETVFNADPDIALLLTLAATRQQQLENEAAHWGLKLYGTKPAAFVRRLGSFYRGWVETSQS